MSTFCILIFYVPTLSDSNCAITGLMMGFSPPSLDIKEGHSMMASLFIISPAVVGVSLTGEVAHARGEKTTAASERTDRSSPFILFILIPTQLDQAKPHVASIICAMVGILLVPGTYVYPTTRFHAKGIENLGP